MKKITDSVWSVCVVSVCMVRVWSVYGQCAHYRWIDIGSRRSRNLRI